MTDREIKRLAEQHHFYKTKLTIQEERILKNSKYAKLVKNVSLFDALVESTLSPSEESSPRDPHNGKFNFANGVSKRLVQELVDDIEDKYNLDISNSELGKYQKVDVEQLKKMVSDFANHQAIGDPRTQGFLNAVAKKKRVLDIMSSLRWYCSNLQKPSED